MKVFFLKLRDVALSSSPIILLIALVNFIQPMPASVWIPFLISAFLLIIGQAIFLTGVESSILTMGELVGNNLNKLKKMWIILIFGFLFGTVATYAEPAVGVLTSLVTKAIGQNIPAINQLFLWIVSSGIGIFVAYALLRIFKQFSIKVSFAIAYLATFILLLLTPNEFRAIAFDFSGATTGVITVPFILALGVGITAVLPKKTNQSDAYGLIGIASIGPVITMCVLGMIFGGKTGSVIVADDIVSAAPAFGPALLDSFIGILVALLPITVAFLIFNFFFIKLPKKRLLRTIYGVVITILGLTVFLTAVKFGFQSAGRYLGEVFTDPARGEWFKYLLIPLGFVLGFAITYTEPAIRVLANQVEQFTMRKIKKSVLVFTLAIGLGLTVMFGILRILFAIPILYFLGPIFALGIILMPFVNNIFVGLAFDSGGVASGTITASFIVPFTIGACSMMGITGDALVEFGFGMIGFIAAIPILAISVLGLIYKIKSRKDIKNLPIGIEFSPVNMIIGVSARIENEQKIENMLLENNARILSTMDAIGLSFDNTIASITKLEDKHRTFILAFISKEAAERVIGILDGEFNFAQDGRHAGIAFTIPIEKIEI